MRVPILYVLSTLDAFAFVLVITTINPYIISLGGTQFYAGVLGSVGAFINLIWNPIAGSLGDSLGRKTVLLQCLFIALIGNLIAASTSSLSIFFFARIVTTFATPIGIFLKSLVDDTIKDKDLKMAAMNKMGALSGSCFIFAALVSGFLSELENGYKYIFLLCCGLFLISFALVSLFVKNQVQKDKRKVSLNMFGEVTKALTNLTKIDWPRYWDLFTIKLIVDFTLMVFNFNFSNTLMNRFGITGRSFGYVFSSVGIMGIVTSLLMPKLKKYVYATDDSGLKRLIHGCLIVMYMYLGLGLSPNFFLYYIHVIPIPIARVLFESTFTEVILARAGPQEKGSVMGAFESTVSLAGLSAPLLSGFIADRWGSETPFLLSIIPLAVATSLAYSQGKLTKRQEPKKRNKKTQ